MPNSSATSVYEESIYSLVPQPTPAPIKAPLYHSKHPHSTPPTASTFGASIATASFITNAGGEYSNPAKVHSHVKEFAVFGPKVEHKADPSAFIAAHTHKPLPQPKKYNYNDRRKESLNTKLDPSIIQTAKETLSASAKRNFIAENSNSATISESKRIIADNKIDYRKKPDYGKIPTYLTNVKAQLTAEQELLANSLSASSNNSNNTNVQLLSESDRQKLLVALKIRWEETMQQYQLLTHMTSNTLSMGNLKRKEELEKKLIEIEKSIQKIDKPYVVIAQ